MDPDPVLRQCARCRSVIRGGDLAGLCPACLIALAVLPTQLDGPSDPTRLGGSSSEGQSDLRLTPGQLFGRFRIERLLGRGGMGEVYAAEQTDDGRRVALKVLSERLGDPHDRARFFREGQLAASVSHPNSVYVYGSEEIDGVPVITMELLAGGTLKDRVKNQGSMSVAEAVHSILQILAGLDAAQTAGILHRDVKPSNCFISADGTVKIGDFGLSISTLAHEATQGAEFAGFRGTPQFASPEQLRGAALDVRTDIYAVGATLFYLLTASPPFDAQDLATLVSSVKSEPPRSPRDLDPRIPRSLASIVLQCLRKDPESRPGSHAALARLLYPFKQQSAVPAEIGLRFAAGVIDAALLIAMLAAGSLIAYLGWGERAGRMWSNPWALVRGTYVLAAILYFVLLEGLWGASLGKRLTGIRVVRSGSDGRIGLRAGLRAAVFCLPNVVVLLAMNAAVLDDLWFWGGYLDPLLYLSVLAGLFATAQRQTGFAGLHDRISATRVVSQSPFVAAPKFRIPVPEMTIMPVSRFRRGPYEVRGAMGSTTEGELIDAFDPVLRRRVWIHEVRPATPALSSQRRDSSRPGRHYWLAGVRSEVEAWDAYEALDGAPLSEVLKASAPWSQVKLWLADLAEEFKAAENGGLPACAFGRVWITPTNRARFLDFEIEGAASPERCGAETPLVQAQHFLYSIANAALRGPADLEWRGRLRLPLHARTLLDRLVVQGFSSMSDVAVECTRAATLPDEVTTQRRTAHIALMTVPVACSIVGFVLVDPIPFPHTRRADLDLSYFLHTLQEGFEKPGNRFPTTEGNRAHVDKADLDALEVYTIGRFGPDLDSAAHFFGEQHFASSRATIGRIRQHHPQVAAAEFASASKRLQGYLADLEAWDNEVDAAFDSAPFEWFQLAMALSTKLHLSLIPVLLSAIVLPGGLMLAGLGIAVVRRDGVPISRARSVVRTGVAWSPVVVLEVLPGLFGDDFYWVFYQRLTPTRATALAILIMLAGACAALITPQRGLQDRIAGTWLVPR